MKKQILLLSIMMIAIFTSSCQVQEEAGLNKDKEKLMFEIASSNLYHKYSELIKNQAFMVATKVFDNNAVGKILDDNPEKIKITDFAKSDFAHIKGGAEYYDNNIKQEQLLDQLDKAYNYSSYSTDEAIKILEMYEIITEMAGEKDLQEKIFEHLSKGLE